ncbi:MAG: hypothetical protein M5U14_03340 [Acidimicrobiia bacterium]|nr:hypothetical protein [Acidimicrobiia bacterium]
MEPAQQVTRVGRALRSVRTRLGELGEELPEALVDVVERQDDVVERLPAAAVAGSTCRWRRSTATCGPR